ncbi:hypothetical protein lerEdw1_016335 [Lerista edwardsae]|nr:hypothetical protein lerEdw1_016335 [Lerista edwardsae]
MWPELSGASHSEVGARLDQTWCGLVQCWTLAAGLVCYMKGLLGSGVVVRKLLIHQITHGIQKFNFTHVTLDTNIFELAYKLNPDCA